MNFSQSFADAMNFANECFHYEERVKPKHNNQLELENEQLQKRIDVLEVIKKQKLKDLAKSRKEKIS
jgi:regulator of replication initiation timing